MRFRKSFRFLLLLLFFSGFQFSASASKPFAMENYKHMRFRPLTIQDLPNRRTGQSLPAIVPLLKTKYRLELDIFFLPAELSAPAFARIAFNARRENHSWVNVELENELGHLATAKEHNEMELAALMPAQLANPGLRASVVYFDEDQIVMRFVSNRPPLSETGSGHVDPHFSVAAGIPEGMFQQPNTQFPMTVDLIFAVFNFDEKAQTIRHRKHFRGEATVAELTPEEKIAIGRLLVLAPNCEAALRRAKRTN